MHHPVLIIDDDDDLHSILSTDVWRCDNLASDIM